MRRLGAALVLAALVSGPVTGLAGGLSVATASPVAAAGTAVVDGEAARGFSGCLAAGGQGRIALVLDTSGSLAKTDADAARVTAAQYVVRQLASEVDRDDVKIDVAVAGFADKFEIYQPWTALDSGSAESVSSTLEDFRDRDNGFETDYWSAANGARAYLDEGGDQGSGETCQAWLWFSDGGYTVMARKTDTQKENFGVDKPYGPDVEITSDGAAAKVLAAGRKDLCRQGGIADQLRVQGVYTFAIGLNAEGAEDFALMQGIADGSDVDGAACGNEPARGQFLDADDIQDLIYAFDQVAGASVDQDTKVNGTHTFVLDPSITSVHVLAGADVADFTVKLVPPAGPSATLTPGEPSTQELTNTSFAADWLSDRQFEMDLTHTGADQGWVGAWQLVFQSPESSGNAHSQIHLYGDIKPEWVDADTAELTSGQATTLQLALVRADTQIDLSKVTSTIGLNGSLELADGSTLPLPTLDKESISTPVPLDLSTAAPGAATLHLELQVTTANFDRADGTHYEGTPLETEAVDYPVTVDPPPDFPTVPASMSFGSADEEGDLEATLPVSGSGCVWLAEDQPQTTPEDVTTGVTSSAHDDDSCVSGKLPLTMSVKGVGTGLASGRLTVMTRPENSDAAPVPVTVSYKLEMQRPRDTQTFVALLVLIFGLGVLLPVLLLYAVKWWTARVPGNALSIGTVRGPVTPTSSFLGGAVLREQEMRAMTLVGTDRRSVAISGGTVLRTRVGLGLTEPGYVVAEGQPSASSAQPPTDRKGRRARLPLAVQDAWVALLDENDPMTGDVEVVFLVSPTSGRLPELQEDARARVSDVVTALRNRLGGSTSGGGGIGGGQPAPPVQSGSHDWGGGSAIPSAPAAPAADDWGSAPSTTQPPASGSGRTHDEW